MSPPTLFLRFRTVATITSGRLIWEPRTMARASLGLTPEFGEPRTCLLSMVACILRFQLEIPRLPLWLLLHTLLTRSWLFPPSDTKRIFMPLWSGKTEECRMYQMYSTVLCPPLRNRQKLDIELTAVEHQPDRVHGLMVKKQPLRKTTKSKAL